MKSKNYRYLITIVPKIHRGGIGTLDKSHSGDKSRKIEIGQPYVDTRMWPMTYDDDFYQFDSTRTYESRAEARKWRAVSVETAVLLSDRVTYANLTNCEGNACTTGTRMTWPMMNARYRSSSSIVRPRSQPEESKTHALLEAVSGRVRDTGHLSPGRRIYLHAWYRSLCTHAIRYRAHACEPSSN